MSVVALILAMGTPLTVSATPSSVSGSITGSGTCTAGAATLTARGGSGQYTYSWTCTGSITCANPSLATTTFSKNLGNGETATGTATCTVTDQHTGATASGSVSVSLVSSANLGVFLAGNNGGAFHDGPNVAHSTTLTVYVTGGGSGGPYNYVWSMLGSPGPTPTLASGQGTGVAVWNWQNAATNGDYYYTIRCTVTEIASGLTGTGDYTFFQDPS